MKKKKKKKKKKTLRAIITDLGPKLKTLCIRPAKTLRSRHYIQRSMILEQADPKLP